MKKLFAAVCAAFALCSAANAQDGRFSSDTVRNPDIGYFSAAVSAGFETEYVFRAEKYSDQAFQAKVELAYPVFGFDLYGGVWTSAPLHGDDANDIAETNFFGGLAYSFYSLRFDLGYVYYWYPAKHTPLSNGDTYRQEIYIGGAFDTENLLGANINPSLYAYYNWYTNQVVAEFSLGYEFPVGTFIGIPQMTLPVNAYAGYLYSDKQKVLDLMGYNLNALSKYAYYGGSVDIAFSLSDSCKISGGVRYSKYFDKRDPYRVYDGPAENIWFGGKFDFGF